MLYPIELRPLSIHFQPTIKSSPRKTGGKTAAQLGADPYLIPAIVKIKLLKRENTQFRKLLLYPSELRGQNYLIIACDSVNFR